MKTDIVFDNLKAGDEVYAIQYGKGKVSEISNSESFPIVCEFETLDGSIMMETFTKNGKFSKYNNFPTIFLTNPFEKLNQERVIEVKVVNGAWRPRVCIKVVDGRALCYCDAETLEQAKNAMSTQVIGAGQWRELQPEQPAAEQPKEITIDGVEYTLTPKTK